MKTFVQMVPKIERHARISFRYLKGDHRDEAVQEVLCNCCAAFARLVEQGRAEAATWSSLARFAVAQVRDGRSVGNTQNVKDVTSRHCQQRKQVEVRSLHEWDDEEEQWREMLVEDKNATPADLAASRIDFPAWLSDTQPPRLQDRYEAEPRGKHKSRRPAVSPLRRSR